MDLKPRFVYTGSQTNEISFPLGGIGTGSIGLAGNGRLIDWEIFNKPNKGSINGFSHFAIKAEKEGRVIDARVLQGDLHPPYSGSINGPMYNSFGFGPNRETLAGLPHFPEVTFTGEFPIAQLAFSDAQFPGAVGLTAFNPFIPLNEFDSGIPAAFFEVTVTNTTPDPLTYTLAGTLSNPLPANNLHTLYSEENRSYLHLRSSGPLPGSGSLPGSGPTAAQPASPDKSADGDLTLAVEAGECSAQAFWFRGAWFDSLEIYWREFNQPGGLKPRGYSSESAGEKNSGSLAARFLLSPGETRSVRFVIAWNFPTASNYWNENTNKIAAEQGIPLTWKNYYATRFENSFSSAQYALENWERLIHETRLFKNALFTSDLDDVVIDAVSANLAVLKTATVMRLEDGTFYGFEGCHPNSGCCEGSCTHVWNYTQAAPFLFPALERSMRAVDFQQNQRQDGGMRFRLPLPPLSAEAYWVFHPCADGQFGNVLKAYADWKISGDTNWLRQFWPMIKQAVEFAWSPSNEYRWDPDKTGHLSGRMHHTLDMELFGPDAWLNGFYLAALKAAAEMAAALNEPATAQEYRTLFEKGKAWVDANLFNGEYYHQIVDLENASIPAGFGVSDTYWNGEHGEIKYQIGEGCEIDQLLAQWHANTYGLGEIFDPQQARTALQSLFKYNFKKSMRGYYNPCRIFALNDEAGLVMCEWPAHVRKPMIPIPYSQEVMTGFEYAAAILMIQTGLVEQGMEIVAAIRGRYDGEKRNPWNEIECGSNYARSMASYGLLLAFSGFSFDLPARAIGFNPLRPRGGKFQTFWSIGSGWGMYRQSPAQVTLEVLYGSLELQRMDLPFLQAGEIIRVSHRGSPLKFRQEKGAILLDLPAALLKGDTLIFEREPHL